MSKFNKTNKSTTKTTSYEGGTVYEKSLEDEWTNMMFSCMLSDAFYEKSEKVETRFIDLTEKMLEKRGPQFVAKAAGFSRNVLGLRTISELTAAILNKYQFDGKRQFFANYFRRPDGIGEIFAMIEHLGDKRSHALIRGAADYLSTLDEYTVGKYQMSKHDFNMHDIINLTHAYSEVLNKYQNGTLETPDTWEVRISTASPEEKEKEWKRLAEERKLGYLALIRNLRNICKCSFATESWCQEVLYDQIANDEAIEKSLVWPYQIYVAWKNARENLPIILELALSEAFQMATVNMPNLSGSNAIILDVSGSMNSQFNQNSSMTILEVSAVYAAALLYKNLDNTEIIKFGDTAKLCNYVKPYKNVFQLIGALQKNDGVGHSTYIEEAFKKLTSKHDRIFLFSDMQIMDKTVLPSHRYYITYKDGKSRSSYDLYREYIDEFGPCHLYSFDLGNYHTQVAPQNEYIRYITSLNANVFKAIQLNEDNEKSLIDLIEAYEV